MTSAPAVLVNDRKMLLTYLDMHPGKTVNADLDPDEVGIVGDPAHRGGYHCGKDRVVSGDYSVVESSRDKNGLTDLASAFDIGWFEVHVNGKVHNLRTFSVWLVSQCKANTDDTKDIREVIYSPDGTEVKRWDRVGKRTTGDSSHLFHTHTSLFRDAVKAGRGLTAVLTRYLMYIGLIKPTVHEGDDMSWLTERYNDDKDAKGNYIWPVWRVVLANMWQEMSGQGSPGWPHPDWAHTKETAATQSALTALNTNYSGLAAQTRELATQMQQLVAEVKQSQPGQPLDYDQLARSILRVANEQPELAKALRTTVK